MPKFPGGFPHVIDLWCESSLRVPQHSPARVTISPTSIPGFQCQTIGFKSNHFPKPRSRLQCSFRQPQYRLRLYVSMRIGEASNPGPSLTTTTVKFAVTNPTSIYQKASLARDLAVDMLMLSETAATCSVQTVESRNFRQYGFDSIWGSPVQPHQHLSADSFKGVASGVSMHSVFPIRNSKLSDTTEWYSAGRIMQAFVQFPHHEFQIITVYGYPSNNRQAKYHTNQLLRHAIAQAQMNTFPLILCGDFNHHPDDLECLQCLWDQGFRTAEQLYQQQTGLNLPPTFRDSTRNDVAIFAPSIAAMVTKVWVDDQHHVPGRNPLCFELQLPNTMLFQQTWKLPQTWLPLQPKPELIAKNFVVPDASQDQHPLFAWSQSVEKAVHLALQEDIQCQDSQQFPGLPHNFRGRCKPVTIKKKPLPRGIKPAWEGQYTPDIDQPTIRIKQTSSQGPVLASEIAQMGGR